MSNEVPSLHTRVAQAFYGSFTEFRGFQRDAVRPLVSGENLVLSAGTGSGKTEAVVAPLVSRYLSVTARNQAVFLLYIVPTKALANDMHARLQVPLSFLGLKVGIRHGDRDTVRQGQQPHVLITTPESLEVLFFRNDRCLNCIRAVVVDEAHLLFNTQRGLHLSILLKRLCQRVGHSLQWAIISATMGNPNAVRDFLMDCDSPAAFVAESGRREIDAVIRFCSESGGVLTLICKLLEAPRCKILLFANTRKECEQLVTELTQDDRLRPIVFAHYSSLAPAIREQVEVRFKAADRAVCVATSTLELGIDIGDIDCIFLYGAPRAVPSFLQRIGRGNRRNDKSNVACLVPSVEGNAPFEALFFHALIELAKHNVLPVCDAYELYGAFVQQALSIVGAVEGKFQRVADLADIGTGHPHLRREFIEPILSQLAASGHLVAHGYKDRYGPGQKLFEIIDLKLIYGNFPIGSQDVPVKFGRGTIASIPRINLLQLRPGDAIRLAGKVWRISRASFEGVEVEPGGRGERGKDIMYPGSRTNLDVSVLDRMRKCIYEDSFEQNYYRSEDRSTLTGYVAPLRKASTLQSVPFARMPVGFCYLTFAGERINRAVALAAGELDVTVTETTITTMSRIQWSNVSDDPRKYELHFPLLFQPGGDQSFFQTLLPERFQRHEYAQSWLKDKFVPEQLSRLRQSVPVEVDRAIIGRFIP